LQTPAHPLFYKLNKIFKRRSLISVSGFAMMPISSDIPLPHETANCGDQYISCFAVPDAVQYGQPEFRAFILSYPCNLQQIEKSAIFVDMNV
jgi:hypothetical protein